MPGELRRKNSALRQQPGHSGTNITRHSKCLTRQRPAAHVERSQRGKGRSCVAAGSRTKELWAEIITLQEIPEHQKAEKRSVYSGGARAR